jgi:small redox-active disulfide protein 2
MEIRILGPGCANCNKLEQLVFNVCAEKNISADIQKISDYAEFAKYGVMMTPGLVVNGKVLSQGKIPTKATLEHWLSEAENK